MHRLIKCNIYDSPFRDTLYSPVEHVDCPEHGEDIDGEIFSDCPNCRRATFAENLRRAQGADLDILKHEKAMLAVPELWREAASNIDFWQEQLDLLPAESNKDPNPDKAGFALPDTTLPKDVYPN